MKKILLELVTIVAFLVLGTGSVFADAPTVDNECPGAPSIAAHYLQELGVKPGSETYKNVVSLVAQHMGPRTDFSNVQACSTLEYEGLVKFFVVNSMIATKN